MIALFKLFEGVILIGNSLKFATWSKKVISQFKITNTSQKKFLNVVLFHEMKL